MPTPSTAVADLASYISASPSPFHAVASSAGRLLAAGFTPIQETEPWPTAPGRYLMVRDGSLIAYVTEGTDPGAGYRIVGAHTDSPNLRLRPLPDLHRYGFAQLAIEVYGGVLLNSWLDRDLGLSGRVVLRAPDGSLRTELFQVDEPIARVPQLAIHLDRAVNTDGLRLNPQQHLTPVWGLDPTLRLSTFLAERLGVDPDTILASDAMFHDLTPPALLGADRSMFAAPRIDNLLSCHAATSALIEAATNPPSLPGPIPLICLFDHEEVGSESSTGAAGSLLDTTLERISIAAGSSFDAHRAALAASLCISADGAHATHPNHPERHEPNHLITLDRGPVVKHNVTMRYASDAVGVATVIDTAANCGITLQQFSSRGDSPCGSTIGPITAARLGIRTVDLGVAQLSMHSARELCGVSDIEAMHELLTALLVAETDRH